MHARMLGIWIAITLAAVLTFVGFVVADRWLKLRGVTVERGRYRRSWLIGAVVGVPLGFWLGLSIGTRWIAGDAGRLGTIVIACVAALGGAAALGIAGFNLGLRLAVAFGVSNGILVRPFWALLRVALPAAIVGAIAGFWFGWTGCRV